MNVSRLAAFLAILFAALLPAEAATRAVVDLNGVEFGHNVNVDRNADPAKLVPSTRYFYNLDGKIHGTGLLATLLPQGTSLKSLVQQLGGGAGQFLSGYYDHPPGTLPFTFINQSFDNTIPVGIVGDVRIRLNMLAQVEADGTVRFRMTNVLVTALGLPVTERVVFEPGSRLTITVPPIVAFQAATATVGEDSGSVSILVERTASPSGPASARWATSDGSAFAGGHYTAKSGTVSFASGETQKTITIPILPNTTVGPDRDFVVTLSKPGSGSELGTITQATVTIQNNDTGPQPFVEFSAPTAEGREGTEAVVEITRSGDVASPISVRIATVPGTALANRHYRSLSKIIQFGPGQLSQAVPIRLLDNPLQEADRTFSVRLAEPGVDVVINPPDAVVTIREDDYAVPATLRGPYTALVTPTPFTVAGAGIASLTVTPFGIYTAKIAHGGKKYAVKGKFGPGGIAPRVRYAKNPDLFLDATITISNAGSIHGDLRDITGVTAAFDAVRSRFGGTSRFSRPGKYHFALQPAAAAIGETAATRPFGFSAGTITLGKTGTAILVAKLADGAPATIASVLLPGTGADETMPCYKPLYRKTGLLHGTLVFPAVSATSDVTGPLRWIKGPPLPNARPDKTYPAGFDHTTDAIGSLFTKPPGGANLLAPGAYTLNLTGGNLAAPLPAPATMAAGNKITADAPNTAEVQIKVSSGSGHFTGSFRPGGVQHKFGGVVLQKQAKAFGWFLGKPATGTPVESGGVLLE